MTNVRQNLTPFLGDIGLLEGRMGTNIWETLTVLMCADCSSFLCILRQLVGPFLALLSPSDFASGANGEVACHRQEHLKPCDIEDD